MVHFAGRAIAPAVTGAAALALGVPCTQAQDIALKPLIDARLRYEHVEQAGIADSADALTLRMRSGAQADSGPFSAIVEGEGTLALDGHYNDGFNGRALPLVADPQNIALTRAQISYANRGLKVTAGRQLLELADQRFVGSMPWRQNEQTFDAVRVQWAGAGGLSVDATYSWSVRTVNGIQGTPARPQSIPGHNWFGIVGYATPLGTVSAFAYLVDQDSAALSAYQLSSQTYGMRLAGGRPIGGGLKLSYIGSVARQSNYARNPNDYGALYGLGEATLAGKVLAGTVGYEVLGADKGLALTSVQTPLASFFRWQGWGGKLSTTPPNGLRDAYATLAASWKGRGRIKSYGLAATYHRFDSDRLSLHYGDELDLAATARIGRYAAAVRYARYHADSFATNTNKLFVTLDWIW